MIPEDLLYTSDHEWIRRTEAEDGTRVRVGITDFAQQALGDIVFVSPPSLGAEVIAGGTLGEVESTKSVSDIYAPVNGTVVARNEALDSAPELVNTDPYGEGWLVEIALGAGATLDQLLSAADYGDHIKN
ncbi:MAG TPA: glycine cleavage system protein GcvH [Mycobacteriales bacterium]|jgi:glycine cleavage system H protein|nr:glycine cleavage system protein GcvH [Mycobacteriales bacterium]